MTEKQINIAIVGGVVVVGVVAVIFAKNILEFLGIKDDKEDKKEKADKQKAKQELEQALKDKTNVLINKGEKPSYLQATYLDVAEIIHKNTQGSYLTDNDNVAVTTLLRYTPKQIDFDMIAFAYGLRPYYNVFGFKLGERTLLQTLSKELTSSEKKRVNDNFKSRGLKTIIT